MSRRRRAARVILVCALACLLGCRAERAASAEPVAVAVQRPTLEEQRLPTRSAASATKHGGPHVKALVGALEGAQEPSQGEALEVNRVLALKAGAELTLDFAQGARVVLRGPAQVVVAPRGEQALLLNSGTAQIDLPPSAPTQASGFWISTPSVRLELVRGGRLAVRAFSDGSSAAFLVSGSAQLAASLAHAPAFVAPGSGLRVALDGRVERTQVAALTLEGALERVLRLPARPGKEGSVRRSLDQSLAQLVDQVAADLAQEQSLVLAHRQRIGTPAALPAQAAVAVHAANLARQRAQLRGLSSRRAALLLEPVPGPDDALGLRAEKLLAR